MKSTHPISHTIQKGDTLFQLARHYQTTVPMILSKNPHINPRNLKVGTTITIFAGENRPSNFPSPRRQIALINRMRLAWSQHVYWTRMLLVSIAERLKDQGAVTERLLQNPKDIAGIFADFYPSDVTETITKLLTEHLQIGAELITALRDGKMDEANQLNRRWYLNADKMASVFSRINPNYRRRELRGMLNNHLELLTQEVSMRLAGKYQADIEVAGRVEQQAMMMADYFTTGLMRQFPKKFN